MVLTARQSEVALRRRVPALSHCEDDGPGKEITINQKPAHKNVSPKTVREHSPWLVYDLSQHPHCVVITHVLKVDVVHLGENQSMLSKHISAHQ